MTTPLMLQFRPDVELEQVLEAVKVAYGRAGCSPCGRLSLFLQAQEVVDPALRELGKIAGVINVAELAPAVGIRTQAG